MTDDFCSNNAKASYPFSSPAPSVALHRVGSWPGSLNVGWMIVINKGGAATAALLSKAPTHPKIRHVRNVLLGKWERNILKLCGHKRPIQKRERNRRQKHCVGQNIF